MGNDQQGARELALGRYLNGPESAFGAFEQGFDAGYSAGSEQMRERAADTAQKVSDHWDCLDCAVGEETVAAIQNLPVMESSRAPEGSTKS